LRVEWVRVDEVGRTGGERVRGIVRISGPFSVVSTVCRNGGRQAVGGHDRPAIGERLDVVGAEVDHRLDRQSHAWPDPLARAAASEVRDLRLLVHGPADPVADQVANDAESARLDVGWMAWEMSPMRLPTSACRMPTWRAPLLPGAVRRFGKEQRRPVPLRRCRRCNRRLPP